MSAVFTPFDIGEVGNAYASCCFRGEITNDPDTDVTRRAVKMINDTFFKVIIWVLSFLLSVIYKIIESPLYFGDISGFYRRLSHTSYKMSAFGV
jgi:hypothetical protein